MLGQRRYELIGIVIQIFKLVPSVVVTSPLKSSGMKEQWEQVVLVVDIGDLCPWYQHCSCVRVCVCVVCVATMLVLIMVRPSI